MAARNFAGAVREAGVSLAPRTISTLQVNVTRLCNQACSHCHVGAGPTQRETMSPETVDRCLEVLAEHDEIVTLDLTGGAPELNPDFERFARGARNLGKHVIVRHNLTVAQDAHPITGESMDHLHDLFAELALEVVSSLPHYHRYLTDRQRGGHAFEKSIASLQALNERGYGREGSGLVLNLVHNPVGPYLPAGQDALERDYREWLERDFGITFNHLFTLVNMPINRFADQLHALDAHESYLERLDGAFNPCAAVNVMCRDMISVGPDGTLYDCDFNQAESIGLDHRAPQTIFDFDRDGLLGRTVAVNQHCFGCTAGAGSSCGGATV